MTGETLEAQLAEARRDGAREMRERAARVAEDDCCSVEDTCWAEAHIKELPLSPTAPDEESNDQ